jgi:hypothetical protein
MTDNQRYENAAKMRVEIAQDVLKQLGTTCIPSPGIYVNFENAVPDGVQDLQQHVLKTKCEVCAQGALFVAAVRRFNEFPAKGMIGRFIVTQRELFIYLSKWFPDEDLNAIEDYFEGFSEGGDFAETYVDATDRMMRIMQNIIDNDGDFSPTSLDKLC